MEDEHWGAWEAADEPVTESGGYISKQGIINKQYICVLKSKFVVGFFVVVVFLTIFCFLGGFF